MQFKLWLESSEAQWAKAQDGSYYWRVSLSDDNGWYRFNLSLEYSVDPNIAYGYDIDGRTKAGIQGRAVKFQVYRLSNNLDDLTNKFYKHLEEIDSEIKELYSRSSSRPPEETHENLIHQLWDIFNQAWVDLSMMFNPDQHDMDWIGTQDLPPELGVM